MSGILERTGEEPKVGKFVGFDHCTFWVTNAKQAANYYCRLFGMEVIAYSGLETGSRDVAKWVIKQGKIVYVFASPYNPIDSDMTKEIAVCGDFVRDVAFQVKDSAALYEKAVKRGAVSVMEPTELKDESGSVIISTVRTYGNVCHSFVQRNDYKGIFLPGFKARSFVDPVMKNFAQPGLAFIDHVVGNQPDRQMEPAVKWYETILDFHRFWSVDDKDVCTDYSCLRSIVVTDWDEVVKMPINEPADGVRKSQIQEYVEYHGGAGVQHIAMNTNDVLFAIENMKSRGCEFLVIPKKYYDNLRERLQKSPVVVKESLDKIEELGILVDFDDNGYLLQLFTKPTQDRPTLFFEVIQRNNHQGFGAGNFKALFEAIERDQNERGNLTADAKK